jgi:galactitol-specific phosphotransferase system IIB component
MESSNLPIYSDNQSLSDNQTVLSDLTDINDTNTATSFVIEDKIDEIVVKLNVELNKLNADSLKEKAKDLGIASISKLKKPEIIQLLETVFLKLLPLLKDKKLNELKNICKQYGIKGIAGSKKDLLIYHILLHSSSTLKFTLDIAQDVEPDTNGKTEQPVQLSVIEQLEKQKLDIELRLKEEETRLQEEKRIQEEKRAQEEKRIQEAKDKKAKDDEDAAKLKEEEDKKETKKKKQSIPKNVRIIVWNHYISEDIIKHKCLCCKKVTISNTSFEVGHVISEKNGGTQEINNLRPICFACNHSMGTENMIDFVVKYGLYIG